MELTVLVVPCDQAEAAADRLWSAGAQAIEELDAGDGRILLRTVLATDEATSRARLGALPDGWRLGFDTADVAHAETWREHVGVIEVTDDLVIVPAWLEHRVADGVTAVTIEPAGAFGLGDHPTTRLAADAVRRATSPGVSMLDVGCGSGVLAIVSLLCGAGGAIAIDVSEAARQATEANAAANGVGGRIEASCRPLAEVEGAFDLVVANILAPTLIELADDLRRVTAPDGRLIVSGVLAERHDHVLRALEPFRVERTSTLDAWACIELTPR